MNHDTELQGLSIALKVVLVSLADDISKVNNPKHLTDLKQEFDKMTNWMIHMTTCMDNLNEWLSAFGDPEEKQ